MGESSITRKSRAFGRALRKGEIQSWRGRSSATGGPRGMLGIVVRCKLRVSGVEAPKSKV